MSAPLQVTTFTDCVNCLIAFTNNPHSLDVSLNAIAFLRFCAMKLAEGAIGRQSLSSNIPAANGEGDMRMNFAHSLHFKKAPFCAMTTFIGAP